MTKKGLPFLGCGMGALQRIYSWTSPKELTFENVHSLETVRPLLLPKSSSSGKNVMTGILLPVLNRKYVQFFAATSPGSYYIAGRGCPAKILKTGICGFSGEK